MMSNSICINCINESNCTALELDLFRDDYTNCVVDCRFFRKYIDLTGQKKLDTIIQNKYFVQYREVLIRKIAIKLIHNIILDNML